MAAERRATKAAQMGVHLPPPQASAESDPLPCPRCESTNTKFCYYNNYNFSQPRHFCKSCRRYWTHGGTLRDIPVGGGTRKPPKRPRSSAVSPPVSSASPPPPPPVLYPSSFTSLLSSGGGSGVFGGFGLGLGLDDVGFGCGIGPRGVWAFPHEVGVGGYVNVNVSGGVDVASGGGDTWQSETGGGESGFSGGGTGTGGGDCFSCLPELAISTPGNCLK